MSDKENSSVESYDLGNLPSPIQVSFGRIPVGKESRIRIKLCKSDNALSKISVERFPGYPVLKLKGTKIHLPKTKHSLGFALFIDKVLLSGNDEATVIFSWNPEKPASVKQTFVLTHQTGKGIEQIRVLVTGVGIHKTQLKSVEDT